MENKEEWRTIEHWDRYEVSNQGRVRNIKTGHILKRSNLEGYLRVTLCKVGKRRNYLVHRLVAEAFLPNPQEHVDHINRDKHDNRVENLQFVTGVQNVRLQGYRKKNRKYLPGVKYKKTGRQRWEASIRVNKKDIYLGRFDSEIEAHEAYARELEKHDPEAARMIKECGE